VIDGVARNLQRAAQGGRAALEAYLPSAEFDPEGRYLEARFGDLSVVSLYLPSGSSSPERQAAKFRFLAEFLPFLAS